MANSTQGHLNVGKKALEPPVINTTHKNNTDEKLNGVGVDAATGLPIIILAIALVIIVSVVILKRK